MANFTPFIQFVGALYLSITIDSILFKRFWNPDFFTMMNSSIDRYIIGTKVDISTQLKEQLEGTAKTKSNQIDTFTRMQGCMMLLYSLTLLVVIGMGEAFCDSAALKCYILFFSILGFLTFLFSKQILKKWWRVFVTSAVVIGVSFVAFVSNVTVIIGVIDVLWIKIGVAVFLLLPLAWRLFYNWLYSTVYYNYIHSKVKEEFLTYVHAKNVMKNKDSAEVDERYRPIFQSLYNSNSNELDSENSCVEKYVEIVEGHLKEVPSIFKLLKHSLKIEKVKDEGNGVEYSEEETVQPLGPQNDNLDIMVKKYNSIKPSMPIDAFCKKNGIDVSKFKKRRNELCKRGSIVIKQPYGARQLSITIPSRTQ